MLHNILQRFLYNPENDETFVIVEVHGLSEHTENWMQYAKFFDYSYFCFQCRNEAVPGNDVGMQVFWYISQRLDGLGDHVDSAIKPLTRLFGVLQCQCIEVQLGEGKYLADVIVQFAGDGFKCFFLYFQPALEKRMIKLHQGFLMRPFAVMITPHSYYHNSNQHHEKYGG